MTGESAPAAGAGEPGRVRIEVVTWVTKLTGGDGTQRQQFDEPVATGATVRSVLRQFSLRFPQLHEALWDRQSEDLAEHIEVLVNDTVLGISHTLDSEVKDGDRISLVGAFIRSPGVPRRDLCPHPRSP